MMPILPSDLKIEMQSQLDNSVVVGQFEKGASLNAKEKRNLAGNFIKRAEGSENTETKNCDDGACEAMQKRFSWFLLNQTSSNMTLQLVFDKPFAISTSSYGQDIVSIEILVP